MKLTNLFLIGVMTLISHASFASNAHLGASDGTAIEVSTAGGTYAPLRIDVYRPDLNPKSRVRAVLTIWTVGQGQAGQQFLDLEPSIPDGHFAGLLDGFVTTSGVVTHGRGAPPEYMYTNFDLAIVVDGQWLTDPVSGLHNFKFQLR